MGAAPAPVRARRRGRPLILLAILVVAGLAAIGIGWSLRLPRLAPSPSCTASIGADRVTLGPAETRNAATIAAVGKRAGLPDHAVTVALAAAMQESKLRNLDYGDRDSVGLFQQRPSQGWGTTEQLRDPDYAAAAFYDRLAQVPDWERLSVTDAAQAVQRSAGPTAYARWEPRARTLAAVLTGQVPAGLSCRYDAPAGHLPSAVISDSVTTEAGLPTVGATVPSPRGWLVASALVARAYDAGIDTVSFDGLVWTPGTGAWRPQPPKRQQVQFRTVAG